MPNYIQSQTTGGEGDCEEMSRIPTTPSLENYASRRKAVLKLIHRQAGIAQRFILDELDLENILSDMNAVSRSKKPRCYVSTHDKSGQTMTPADSGDSSTGQMKKNQLKQGDTPEEDDDDDEDIFELEWTMSFDSVKDLIEYKSKYVDTVESLTEYSNDLRLSQSQPHITTKKVGSGKFASSISLDKELSVEDSCLPEQGSKDNKKLIALCKVYTTQQLYVAAIAMIVAGLYVLCPPIEPIFNFINEFEWPWSIFMREPILRGFIQSSSHFELYRYRTEDELDY